MKILDNLPSLNCPAASESLSAERQAQHRIILPTHDDKKGQMGSINPLLFCQQSFEVDCIILGIGGIVEDCKKRNIGTCSLK